MRRDHHGFLAARDACVEAATGEFVAFLDADDCWAPTKLERQLAAFAEHPGIDLCVTLYRNFWEDPATAEAYAGHPLSEPQGGYVVPALMARRSLLTSVAAFAEPGRRGETGWFADVMARGCTLHTVPEVLLHRRIHGANESIVQTSSSLDGIFELIAARRRAARDTDPGA